jgi:hypothetical protein
MSKTTLFTKPEGVLLNDQSGSVLGDSTVFSWAGCHIERFMSVLKKYVLNRARPEGSIAKGYVTEEVIEFCVDFVNSIDSIGVPLSRHEGRLLGKGTIGRKACFNNDTDLFNKAHLAVLQQSTLVTLYIEEHK